MTQRQAKAQTNLKPYRYCGSGSALAELLLMIFRAPGSGERARSCGNAGVVEPVLSAILWMVPVVRSGVEC